jgi:hypothetical protein
MKVLAGIITGTLAISFAVAQSGGNAGTSSGTPALRTVPLNGGLEAELLSMGRTKDHHGLTVQFKIRNLGKYTADLVLVQNPVVATDNTGGLFNELSDRSVSGIALCRNNMNFPQSQCISAENKQYHIALQGGFTRLEPNPDPRGGITVNLRLIGESNGPLISFAANLFVRFITDPTKTTALSDEEQYKQFHMMSLSFPLLQVTDEK